MTANMSGIGKVVQMHNVGTEPFNMPYGRERLIINAGEAYFCTEEIAAHFLGRWWLDNSDPKLKERAEEIRRLRTLYGAYEDEAMWERNKPKVVLYQPNGERIVTVVDDPEGYHARPRELVASSSPQDQMNFLMSEMQRLQQQINTREGMPPMVDPSLAPPPPPPHSPTAPFTTVPNIPGAVSLAAPTMPPAAPTGMQPPTPAPATPTATMPSEDGPPGYVFDPDSIDLADLSSAPPASDDRYDSLDPAQNPDFPPAASPTEPPTDEPEVMKTGARVRTGGHD